MSNKTLTQLQEDFSNNIRWTDEVRSILAQCDIYYYGWNWTVFVETTDFYDELLGVDVVFMRISWYKTQRYANIWSIILWIWYHGKVRIMNILVRRNRTSANLEIGVPVLENRLFCDWWLIHFCWDIGQDLATFAVHGSFYQYHNRNYDSVCTKTDLKSDFYITG